MLNLTSIKIGIVTACLLSPSLTAIAAVPKTSQSVRILYAQGVFDFNNGERQLSVGQSPSIYIDGPSPKPYINPRAFDFNRIGQFRNQFEQKAEEQRQRNSLYLNRWPATSKDKK